MKGVLLNKDTDMELFDVHCQEALSPIPDMAYYNCVALCALDAVFSIRTRYSTVERILNRFCEHFEMPLMAETPHSMPALDKQMKISEFAKKMGDIDAGELATIVHNKQLTTAKGRNRILKSEAFLKYLEVFKKHNIETFQDVNACYDRNKDLDNDLKAIPGQNVAVDYFFMLAGDEDGVKVDKHIRTFTETAVGRHLTNDEIKSLFADEVLRLRANGYPEMTARHLDHIIWSWQKWVRGKTLCLSR